MFISVGNLGKPFLTWKTYLQTKMIKNNHYTKNHIQELDDKKNVNTKSMIIGNSPIKKKDNLKNK